MRRPVFTIATHTQAAFRPDDTKGVYSAGRSSLLAHTEALRMGTLDMVLAKPATSLPMATIKTACNLLFALRKAYKNALDTP